jgi:soluble lytic murein transglycosylase
VLKRVLTGLAYTALISGTAWSNVAQPVPRPVSPIVETTGSINAPVPQRALPPAPNQAIPASMGSLAGSSGNIRRDAPLVKEALAQLKKGNLAGATSLRDQARDPATQALIEWLSIRHASRQIGSDRIIYFMRANPHWPVSSLIRRRAEEALYLENASAPAVHAFFGGTIATTPMGKLAQARTAGNRSQATQLVRQAWMEGDFPESLEPRIASEFGGLLTADDHVRRTEYMLHDGKTTAALRAARLTPAAYQSVVRARIAVAGKASNAKAALDAVPSAGRRYTGYIFAQADYLLRQQDIEAAAKILHQAPRDPAGLVDPDSWWQKRRWLARDLLDLGDARTAYQVASEHAGGSAITQADAAFHAGWIALRFLNNPSTAARHFNELEHIASGPLTRSRAGYWQGRTAEALGDRAAAARYYAKAAGYATTYYGQLARIKLGGHDLPLRPLPSPSGATRNQFATSPGVRGIELLYAIGEDEETIPLFSDLATQNENPQFLGMLAGIAQRNNDTRALLLVGKSAVANGHPLETVAWPTTGIPSYRSVGPAIEPAVVHSIARQESAFNPKAISHADARGLLQLIPATARKTANTFGVPFDVRQLTNASYNASLGAAHLGELAAEYNGSYVMTFAAYNAGHSKVMAWVQRYGDPRDPRIDPVDWVERIPYQETRNYVQRVLENVQVYRARLSGNRSALNIEADLRRGMASR